MKRFNVPIIAVLLLLVACKDEPQNGIALNDNNAPDYRIETVIDGLSNPWGMDWLPDGSMLITEKNGEFLHYKDGTLKELQNGPDIYVRGQGGLLDIAVHPDYPSQPWIYFTFSSDSGAGSGGNTQLTRARIEDGSLTNIQTLYKAAPNSRAGQHFGSRIAFDLDGYIYFSIGDRGNREENPQDLSRDGGKIYRLHDDGRIPQDNPFVGTGGAKEAVFSYGHRNPQGLIRHPETGVIWSHEHGPKGGDEINIIQKGKNYGWPVITYGVNYSGSKITDETARTGMEQPVYYWVPSIAPCGMDFVTGDRYPDWKGHLLVGSLKFNYIELVKLDGNKVIDRIKIAEDIGRVRNVKMGPDGFIYVSIEGRGIFKIVPNE